MEKFSSLQYFALNLSQNSNASTHVTLSTGASGSSVLSKHDFGTSPSVFPMISANCLLVMGADAIQKGARRTSSSSSRFSPVRTYSVGSMVVPSISRNRHSHPSPLTTTACPSSIAAMPPTAQNTVAIPANTNLHDDFIDVCPSFLKCFKYVRRKTICGFYDGEQRTSFRRRAIVGSRLRALKCQVKPSHMPSDSHDFVIRHLQAPFKKPNDRFFGSSRLFVRAA